MQFIIIARDKINSLKKRLEVREKHIKLWDKMKKNGEAIFWVALLDKENQMNWSVYIVDFPSREELEKYLKIEPYVTNWVWDKIEIIPCKIWPSFI